MQDIQKVSNHTIREIDDLMKDRIKEIQHEHGKDKDESKDISKPSSPKKMLN